MARQISEGTGKTVVFKQISSEEAMRGLVSLGYPPAGSAEIVQGFLFFDEFGLYGGAETTSTEGLARPTRTFAEFVKSADWSKVLV
ncbi:hypothetical protein B0H14DRAFT_372643 [Mycena olivaceomarginata]|nr:hypothetical protein B0H14DRAFT_372643 [Mycena olivaceomarginata]